MSRWRVWLALIVAGLFILFLAVVAIEGHRLPQISPATTGFIGIGILIIFLFSGLPIAVALGLVGFLGIAYLEGLDAALVTVGGTPYRTANSYILIVIPLFVLMGEFAFHSGLSRDLYDAFYKWVGHMPGGLAMATVGACAAFGAICGSSIATSATMGTVSLPEMKRYKYEDGLACGSVAAGATLAGFIPPSVAIVIYCLLTRLSVGTQFIASFLPGAVNAILFMTVIYIISKRSPLAGPRGPSTSFMEKLGAFKAAWVVVGIFILVIGGLYTGVFTPTEAAGVGAFCTLLVALGKRKLTWQNLMGSIMDTGKISAMIFLILIGAKIFGYLLAVTGLPTMLASFVAGLEVSRYVVWAALVLMYMFLGCIMDSLAVLIITIPVVFPLMMSLGFNPIWLGVAITINDEMACITPPVGINVFVVKGVARDVPMYTIFRGIIPFVIVLALYLILITAFPQIVMFVPDALGLTY